MTGPLVFLVAFAMELVYATWTIATSQKRPLWAAVSGILIVYGGTFLIQTWMDDHTLVHWTAAGHGLGAYVLLKFLIWWEWRKKNEQVQ